MKKKFLSNNFQKNYINIEYNILMIKKVTQMT